jgi:hypothetical protein
MRPHRMDGVSFSFGLIFALVVLFWAAGSALRLTLPVLGWLVAVGLLLFGIAGVTSAVRAGRRPVPEPEPVAPVSGVPAEMQADIVRELMGESPRRAAQPATTVVADPLAARPTDARPTDAEFPVAEPPTTQPADDEPTKADLTQADPGDAQPTQGLPTAEERRD